MDSHIPPFYSNNQRYRYLGHVGGKGRGEEHALNPVVNSAAMLEIARVRSGNELSRRKLDIAAKIGEAAAKRIPLPETTLSGGMR